MTLLSRMRKRAHFRFIIAACAALLASQTTLAQSIIEGTLQVEDASPSLIHVKRIDYPALQLGIWVEEILVDEAAVDAQLAAVQDVAAQGTRRNATPCFTRADRGIVL